MVARPALDRCPGLQRPFDAADGAILRARVPGGRIGLAALDVFLAAGERWGAPIVQLTSRANLQIRALPTPIPAELADAVLRTGWFPSVSHERARNVIASPTARDLGPIVAALDEQIMARPALAQLPGRFLFLVTDWAGLGLTTPWDLAWQRLGGPGLGEQGRVLARLSGGEVVGMPGAAADAAATLAGLAETFLAVREDGAWNVRDLPPGSPARAAVTAGMSPVSLGAATLGAAPLAPGPVPVSTGVEPGEGPDLVVGLPLGQLDRAQLGALQAITDEVVATPWRSLLVPGGAAYRNALAAVGLVVDAADPWAHLSACTGSPWCHNGRSPVVALAHETVAALRGTGAAAAGHVHLVGCERHCGASRSDVVLECPADTAAVLAALAGGRS